MAYRLPGRCPVCGAAVLRDEDGVALRCTGVECPAQLSRNIAHFVSREAMNIDGLGSAIVDQLIDAGLVHSPADLYFLDRDEVEALERMGKQSTQNLLRAIEQSKQNDLSRLLHAFGIRQVGIKAAKVLARTFLDLDTIMDLTAQELTQVPDIGLITAENIVSWFADPQSRDMIARLRLAGVNFKCNETVADTRFAGMTFVLTGALSLFTREEATLQIEKFGGKAAGSVSKKTSYVVAGENAGSKLKKANELNIPVLSEEEFVQMLQ